MTTFSKFREKKLPYTNSLRSKDTEKSAHEHQSKTLERQRRFKTARKKMTNHIKETSIHLDTRFLPETMVVRRHLEDIFRILKNERKLSDNLHPAKYLFKTKVI